MDKPSLNQITSLMTMLENNSIHFGNYDVQSDKSFEAFEKMSYKQYKYLLYLIFNNHYSKAKELLNSLGVE